MTEKNYNPEQKNAKSMKSQKNIPQEPHAHKKAEEETKTEEVAEAKEGKKEEKKQPIQKKEKVKKTTAVVNGKSVPVSTLDSIYICNFIRHKSIEKALADLEDVLKFVKPVPMKREIPHRKGKGMMSGRYPLETTKHFIKLLKSLQSNANANGIDEPIIVEAIANMAYRPFGRFGRVRRKRTHISLKAMEKKLVPKRKKIKKIK